MWKNCICQDNQKELLLFLSPSEKRYLTGKSIIIVLILNYFFYQSIWAFFPLSGIGFLYYRLERKYLLDKKKEAVREQFKELMLLVSTSQRAGFSAENSFISSYNDLRALYGRDSSICQIIMMLKSGRENNIAFSKLWKQIGESLEIDEIREFSQVYEISQHSSGNMASVMDKTADIIVRKIETEKEIAVLLSAKKLEQKIMNIMPFAIMLYISIASPGYFQGLYHTISGVLVMSICLLVYLGAYILSVRIISIEV